jgi:hypothetical protein
MICLKNFPNWEIAAGWQGNCFPLSAARVLRAVRLTKVGAQTQPPKGSISNG